MSQLIGISGVARSGKDTFGKHLEALGYKVLAFAEPMRAAARAIDPVVGTNLLGDLVNYSGAVDTYGYDEAKARFPEMRRFLQRLGTEFGREQLGENFWVDTALQNWSPGMFVAITDVRFRNEAKAIKSRGGIVVRVERDGIAAPNDHISEHDLDDWDFDLMIDNNGTIGDLRDQAVAASLHRA